jgi:hypothetical protein
LGLNKKGVGGGLSGAEFVGPVAETRERERERGLQSSLMREDWLLGWGCHGLRGWLRHERGLLANLL